MKKKTSTKLSATTEDDSFRAEYDFSGGVRGKHYRRRRNGYTIKIHKQDGSTMVKKVKREGEITLAPDVRKYFPTSQDVNRVLRALIALIPKKGQESNPSNSVSGTDNKNSTRSRL
jgi:hypothetical protein